MSYYYESPEHQTAGPTEESEIHRLRQQGVIKDTTLVVPVGGTKSETYQDFFRATPPPTPSTPPPIPSNDELMMLQKKFELLPNEKILVKGNLSCRNSKSFLGLPINHFCYCTNYRLVASSRELGELGHGLGLIALAVRSKPIEIFWQYPWNHITNITRTRFLFFSPILKFQTSQC